MKLFKMKSLCALLFLNGSITLFSAEEFPQLSAEIWGKEVYSLPNLISIINTSASMEDAIKEIRKLALLNPGINKQVNNSKVCQELIQKLAEKGKCSTWDAANALNISRTRLQLHLAVACYNGNTQQVKDLIKQGADVNFVLINSGLSKLITPLMLAIPNRNNTAIIKCLIDNGANIDFTNQDGETALMLAVGFYFDPDAAEVFKDYLDRFDINKKTHTGYTVLTYYLMQQQTAYSDRIVPLLLEMGADPELDYFGTEPIDFASNRNDAHTIVPIIQRAINKKHRGV